MANLFGKYVFEKECVQIPLVETGEAKGEACWILPGGVLRDRHVSPPADLARPIGLRFFLLTFGPSKIHFNLTANDIPVPFADFDVFLEYEHFTFTHRETLVFDTRLQLQPEDVITFGVSGGINPNGPCDVKALEIQYYIKKMEA